MRLAFLAFILICVPAALCATPANTPSNDICEFLRDDNRYSGDGLRYSDLGSAFSVFNDNRAGIGTMLLDWNGESRIFSDAPLTLDVLQVVDGRQVEVSGGRTSQCYPHGIQNRLLCRGLELTTFVTFIDTGIIVCLLDVKNTGEARLKLAPRLRGEIAELQSSSRQVVFDASGNMLTFKSEEPGLGSNAHLSSIALYGGVFAGFPAQEVRIGENERKLRRTWELNKSTSAAYSVAGPQFDLEPGKTRRLWAIFGLSINDKTSLEESLSKSVAAIKPGVDVEKQSRDRWNKQFRRMPAPPTDERAKRTYYQSAWLLMNNVSQAGGNFGKNRPCFANRRRSVVTPFQASTLSIGLAEIDTQLAREQILILTENIQENGSLPSAIGAAWLSPEASLEPPVVAAAAWNAYRKSKDRKFLETVYDPLCKFTNWWFLENDSDYDGLCELTGSDGEVYDSAEINGHLVVQMRALASMALALQKREDYHEWMSRVEDLKRRISETLYSPEDNAFYDATVGSHELRKRVSPARLTPLWAGVELPRNKARDMIWEKALRPNDLACELPSPAVVSRFDECDAISPIAVRALFHGLRNTGYSRNAKRVGDQLLNLISSSDSLCEAFDATAGKGIGDDCAITAAVVLDAVRAGAGRP